MSAIRRIRGITLQNVRKAIAFLRKQSHSQHPLIDREFLTDGKDLFIERFSEIINISQHGQGMFQWLDLYLQRIDRDDMGRPVRLFPFTARIEEDSPRRVAIDPSINFGKPCISGTDIPTAIVAERFDAGDSLDELTKDYGRSRLDIEEAVRYERRCAA